MAAQNTPAPAQDATPAPPIAELRDIILPETLHSYWLAPGWIIIIAVVLLAAAGAALLWYRRNKLNQYRRQAVALIEDWLKHQNPNASVTASQLAELSALLKRVALHSGERAEIARLYGSHWAEFLRAKAPGAISDDNLTLLSEGEYQASIRTETNCQQLAQQCQRWVQEHRAGRPYEVTHATV
ncbi:DUF4381 domain-containing protein [Halioxenophilus aromaticivorans]|uniref:DUF4381 domain-containing protein n=1 Tax=Halioxenophilus aromaticivorans TaxID=1306992 RepID=A0AAV3TY83_9ALTE